MMSRMTEADGHIVVVGQWRHGGGRVPVPYALAVAASKGRAKIASTFELRPADVPPGVTFSAPLDPTDSSVMEGAVGLLLPGGGDIDPRWYGRPRHPRTHNVYHRRDLFERTLLEVALERDLPTLAICHGMQMLNVHLGGVLDQHLADRAGRLDHDRDLPSEDPVHSVSVAETSKLAAIFGSRTVPANSHHHQGLDGAADPLVEVAWAEDGVLEAVESATHTWVVGVQWHPEVMAPVHLHQRRLFDAFVAAARAYEGAPEDSSSAATA